jgi:hypothetical protein
VRFLCIFYKNECFKHQSKNLWTRLQELLSFGEVPEKITRPILFFTNMPQQNKKLSIISAVVDCLSGYTDGTTQNI